MANRQTAPHISIRLLKDGSYEVRRVGVLGQAKIRSKIYKLPPRPKLADKSMFAQHRASVIIWSLALEDIIKASKAEILVKMGKMVNRGIVTQEDEKVSVEGNLGGNDGNY